MARILLLALALYFSSSACAQKVYQSSNYAASGDSFILSQISLFDLGNEDFRPTGPEVIWDHHNLYPYAQRIANFTTPSKTGFLPSFLLTCTFNCINPCTANCVGNGGNATICGAICNGTCGTDCLSQWGTKFNLAELTNDSINLGFVTLTQVYNLYKKDQTGLYLNGLGARLGNIPIVVNYDAPDKVYRFPMHYGDSAISVSSYSIKLDTIPGIGINFSFSYKHAQTRSNYVDGWGKLITPYATYDSLLKHRSVIHNRDSVTVLGNTITLSSFLPDEIIPDTVIEYTWFDKSEGVPVLKVTAWLVNGNEIYQSAEFRDTIRCFEPSAVFGYLPIPATLNNGDDSVEVNFYSLSFNANTFNWNFDDSLSNNNTSQGQSPSHWYSEGGLYSVTLTICNTGCIAGWCKDVTLPVLVIDNRTVGISSARNDAGWHVGPNPFSNVLSLEYTGNTLVEPQFSLLNIAGKQLNLTYVQQSGNRFTWQGLDALPEGVYLLIVNNGNNRTALRIVKMGGE
ncbi:hypothetical protein BH09BAC1_BH09BAC1_18300 [soil metagenome]